MRDAARGGKTRVALEELVRRGASSHLPTIPLCKRDRHDEVCEVDRPVAIAAPQGQFVAISLDQHPGVVRSSVFSAATDPPGVPQTEIDSGSGPNRDFEEWRRAVSPQCKSLGALAIHLQNSGPRDYRDA